MKRVKLKTELDELTLLELFWVEPTISQPKDGYACYEVTDEQGVKLKFGVDIIQESVQIDLKLSDIPIVSFSYEQVEYLDIIDESQGKFAFSFSPKEVNFDSNVQVQLRPKIKISGATLLTS